MEISKDALLTSIMKLAVGVISEMVETPKGAEVVAEVLRHAGWRCTPPAAAKKKRTRRG